MKRKYPEPDAWEYDYESCGDCAELRKHQRDGYAVFHCGVWCQALKYSEKTDAAFRCEECIEEFGEEQ